jgi:hypothetical protein
MKSAPMPLGLSAEPLEPRALLAVTATLTGGDLVIAYNDAGDVLADISSDGTKYTVTGSGLVSKQFNVANVTGVITVKDLTTKAGQTFTVLSGTALANPLQVEGSVETTSLLGGIVAATAGDVLIGSNTISLANDISTAAKNGGVTLSGDTTLASNATITAGAGTITFSSTLNGGFGLTANSTGNVTFNGAVGGGTRLGAISIASATNVTASAITAASLSQAAGSGTTTLNGAVNTNAAAGVSLTGTNLAVNAGITTTNSGTVTFNQKSGTIAIAAAGDILADGAVSLTATGGITTAGDVTTTNDDVTFASKTTLSGPVAVNTGAGAGNITYSSTLDGTTAGAQDLALTAGTGNVTFNGAVGGGTRLGAISIASATNVTASAITAASLSQAAGSGTTTLNGAVNTNAAAGVSLTGTNLAVNAGITTTNSGTVTFNQKSGTIAIAAAGDILADGAVSLTATGGITTAGDVTTTNDDVTFASKTTLSGPVAVNTGAGAGNITYSSTLDGTTAGAQDLALTAGTGNVTFNGAVGGGTRLGAISIASATNVTASAITAASLSQAAGSGTTTLNGAVNTNAAAGVSLTGTNLAVNAGITTTNSGTVTFNQKSGTIAIAAAGDILADGAVSLTATGGITTAGDVTTTNDDVTFASKTTLSGPVAVNTGAGAGNITYSSTLDGAKLATFAAGTGAVEFKGAVGSTQALAGITLTSAGSTTADSSIKLAKAADSGTDGLTVAAGVNNVKMTAAGSSISGFAANGVAFLGGSTNSQLGGFTVSGNAGNGLRFASGSYLGTTIANNTISNNGDLVAHTGSGILVQGSDLMIGWDATATSNNVQNVISGNGLNGIEISGAAAVRNAILSNSIFLNGQGLTQVVAGDTVLVGKGIALTSGGNGAQVAPTIHDVVRDSKNGKVYVQVLVPAAGSYLVQLFANSAADEQGIFPADPNGFQGRAFVGESPSGSPASVGTGKPIISGVPVAGNTMAAIEVDASLVAAGDWITATATLLDGTTPTNTSGFSAGVQALSAQALAAGGDGQAPKWLSVPTIAGQLTNRYVNELAYKAINGNTIEIPAAGQLTLAQLGTYTNRNANGRVIRAGAPNLASPQTEVTLAPTGNPVAANAFGKVTGVTRVGNTGMRLTLSGVSLTPNATGFLVLGVPALPAARLYDAANFGSGASVSVGPATSPAISGHYDMVASLTDPTMVGIGGKGAATPAEASAFVSRFQGGMRVASADVNGDGYVDLVTAPGDAGAGFAGSVFGDAPRIITIYNGNPAGLWQSSSINVSGETGLGSYTGGFQVSLANLRPENTGSGNAVAELVVASANNVFVYEIAAASRGAKPVINPVVAQPVITTVGSVTGLATGTFTSPTLADIIVATTTATTAQVTQWLAGADLTKSLNRPAAVTVYSAAANFVPTSTFTLGANLFNGNRQQNVFIGGASLAVGDVDNAPDQKPELILGAGFMGMGNFRVLANDVVVTGKQAVVDNALSANGQFGRAARGTVNINAKNVWQPTGGPDFFTTNKSASNENLFQPTDGITVAPTGAGFNAPLSVAALQTGSDFKSRIFAALGATNGTKGTVRAFTWIGSGEWTGAKVIDVENGVGTQKGRLPRGSGLRLG